MLRLLATFAVTLFAVASACAQQFPLTIAHAYGETIIDKPAQRVVTWGWSSTEASIALGVVPVGFPTFRSEGFDEDVVPWVARALAKAGADVPFILDNSASPPIEQIAALKPDLILAVYSGITEDEYKLLSQIAPVVPFPEAPWTASWQQVITIAGEALGKPDEGKALVGHLEQFVRDEAAKYPELDGTSVVTLIDYDGALAIHSAEDARAKMLALAGMTIPPKPDAAGPSQGFWYPMSYENADQIPADVLIPFFSTTEAADAFFAIPTIASAPQVKKDAVVRMDDRIFNAGVISSSALSIEWAMPRYFELIAEAARKAREQ